jgi:hypothetical protein
MPAGVFVTGGGEFIDLYDKCTYRNSICLYEFVRLHANVYVKMRGNKVVHMVEQAEK